MELKLIPFTRDSFLNNREYSEARDKFLTDEYVGKTVVFKERVLTHGGFIRYDIGYKAKIRDIGYEWFKLSKLDGTHIEGELWSPKIFDLVD